MIYMAYSEKNATMKGTTMTQKQYDNMMLRLEWETKFAAILVTTELNHKNRK